MLAAQIGMIVRFQVSATTDKAAAIVQVYDETGALVMSGIGHGADVSPQEPALVDTSAYSTERAADRLHRLAGAAEAPGGVGPVLPAAPRRARRAEGVHALNAVADEH
ncbi:MAG: hypothetical protein U0235_11000 [Polyangiaceae bacterium]